MEFSPGFQTIPTLIQVIKKLIMNLQLSKEYTTAMLLEQALNDYSWSPSRFAESINYIHKTLQQTLVRTIVEIIKEIASEYHNVDSRNKASQELCKEIVGSGLLDKYSLPMI